METKTIHLGKSISEVSAARRAKGDKALAPFVVVRRLVPGIGDAIMMEPVLRRFQELGRHVAVISKYPAIFSRAYECLTEIPQTAKVIELGVPCPAAAYESTHRTVKKSRIQLFLETAGLQFQADVPQIRGYVRQKHPHKKQIGVAIISATYNDPTDGWRDYPYPIPLLNALKKIGDVTWFHTEHANVTGIRNFKGNIEELIMEINEMDVMITIDSAGAHIAGALGVPQFALFGPTDPTMRVSQYPNAHFLEKSNCPVAYCWYQPCKERFCLSTISVKFITKKIKELL